MKKLSRVLLAVMALVTVFSCVAGAAAPYATYTYSADGFTLNSPEAYVPDMVVDSGYIGLEYRATKKDAETFGFLKEAGLNV